MLAKNKNAMFAGRSLFRKSKGGLVASYDFGNAASYVLGTTDIVTIKNLGKSGSILDSTQATSTKRAVLTSGQAVFDGVDDHYVLDPLASLIQSGSFLIDVTVTASDLLVQSRTILSTQPASGSGYFFLQFVVSGKLRFVLRNTANTNVYQGDFGTTGIGGAAFTVGQEYRFRFQLKGNLLNVWIDNTQVGTNIAVPWTSGDAIFYVATLGAQRSNGGGPTNVINGSIRKFLIQGV